MNYREASPRRSAILRSVVRLVVCVGAIVAVWLITPTEANALEDPTGLDGAVTDATADALDSIGTEPTVTDVIEGSTGQVTDTVEFAGTSVTDAVEEPTEDVSVAADVDGHADTATDLSSATRDAAGAARDAAASIGNSADDAVSTVENAADSGADIEARLQDAGSSVDLDALSAVKATVESVIELVATVRPIDADGMAMSGNGIDVASVRFGDERGFTIRGPPVTTGLFAAASTSDDEAAARLASGEAPSVPVRSDGLPSILASTARDVRRASSSFNDVAAILAAIMLALGFARSVRREAELRHKPIFLPLAEHPG